MTGDFGFTPRRPSRRRAALHHPRMFFLSGYVGSLKHCGSCGYLIRDGTGTLFGFPLLFIKCLCVRRDVHDRWETMGKRSFNTGPTPKTLGRFQVNACSAASPGGLIGEAERGGPFSCTLVSLSLNNWLYLREWSDSLQLTMMFFTYQLTNLKLVYYVTCLQYISNISVSLYTSKYRNGSINIKAINDGKNNK